MAGRQADRQAERGGAALLLLENKLPGQTGKCINEKKSKPIAVSLCVCVGNTISSQCKREKKEKTQSEPEASINEC